MVPGALPQAGLMQRLARNKNRPSAASLAGLSKGGLGFEVGEERFGCLSGGQIWTERLARGIGSAAGQAYGFGNFAFTRQGTGEIVAGLEGFGVFAATNFFR